MKKSVIIICLFIILICVEVFAVEIVFENGRPENASEISKLIKENENPSFTLLDSLTRNLSGRGYLDAAITIKNGKLFVSCGEKYFLSKVQIAGEPSSEIAVNRPFDSAIVAATLNLQLQILYDSGYHYATCQANEISMNGNFVYLTVNVNKGPLVTRREILFAGLTRSNKSLIKRYLPDNTDAVLTSSYLAETEKAASQISFSRFSPPITVQPLPGYASSDITLNFIEKSPVRFDGAAGLAGRGKNDIVWTFGLAFNNLFGEGKQIDLLSDKTDSRRRSLSIKYSQPWFILGLGELALNVQTRDYRDEFYEFSLGAGYNTHLSRQFSTGLNLKWKSVSPKATNSGYNSYSGQFTIKRKTYADDFNPRQGYSINWGVEFAFRGYFSSSQSSSLGSRTFNETRNSISTSVIQPLAGSVVAGVTLNYSGLETREDFPQLSELILIGGPGSLRGYRNEQFAAIRSAFGTIEPRVRFSQGYLCAFYDGAYLNNRVPDSNGKVKTDEQFKWSYGIGLGIGNLNRSVKLSLGINPEFGIGDPRLSVELSSDI